MQGVAKIVPPKKEIIKDISLSFFYGAKIGVLGLNGAGKSTLLKIIAGEDKDYIGEITYQKNLTFGYLPQEPRLDPNKDVKGNVEDGVKPLKDMLNRFDELSAQFAEPMSDETMQTLMEEQGKLQDAIEAAGGWDLDRKLEVAADALRLPAWDPSKSILVSGIRSALVIVESSTN